MCPRARHIRLRHHLRARAPRGVFDGKVPSGRLSARMLRRVPHAFGSLRTAHPAHLLSNRNALCSNRHFAHYSAHSWGESAALPVSSRQLRDLRRAQCLCMALSARILWTYQSP